MKFIKAFITLLIIFLFFTDLGFAQNNYIDSLKVELQNHKERDTTRVDVLYNLAFSYSKKDMKLTNLYIDEAETINDSLDFEKGKAKFLYLRGYIEILKSNNDSGLDYFKQSLKLYKKINDKKGISKCYNNLGVIFFRNRDYKTAIDYYLKAIKIREEIGNNKGVINGLYYVGLANGNIGNYTDAIIYYKKVLRINEETNNVEKISRSLTGIGNIYSHQGNYPLALEYHNKSLAIAKKNENDKSISDALMSIGNVYIRLQNYDKAIEFHGKALEITKNMENLNTASILNNLGEVYMRKKNYKKAYSFFEQALTKFENKGDIAICLNNIGTIYLELKDDAKAQEYFEKAKKINLEVENNRGLCDSYLGIAKIYFNQKKYDKALTNTLKSIDISSKLELMDIQRNAQQLLSEIYEKKRQYKKAFSSHQQFKILNDSLFNKENIEKIAQIEYEYKYKQALDSASIRELKLTKTVTATSENLQKSQRNYLWAIIAFLLASILLGSIIFYQKLRHVKSKTQNIIIEQKLLRSQMTPHFIFNSLSVLQGMILNKENEKSVYYLSKFSKLLRIILENSRDQTVSLADELTAIQHYLALQNLENEAYQYTVLVEDTIDVPVFEIPPMLIQPFVENAIEHAFVNQIEDRKIDIRLTYLNKQLICTITDNGIGVNAQKETKPKDKNSLATTITSERLKILSKDLKMAGSVTIEDRQKYKEKGTLVTLVVPHKILTIK